MWLSENVQIALISAVAVGIPAVLAQYWMHIRQSRKIEETKGKVVEATSKLEGQSKKLVEIHDQTNSNFDKQRDEIKGLNTDIRVLIEEKAKIEGKVEEQGNPTEKK